MEALFEPVIETATIKIHRYLHKSVFFIKTVKKWSTRKNVNAYCSYCKKRSRLNHFVVDRTVIRLINIIVKCRHFS